MFELDAAEKLTMTLKAIRLEDLTCEPLESHPPEEMRVTGNPRRWTSNLFANESGTMRVGIWEAEVGSYRIRFSKDKDEFFHLVSGKIRLHADGEKVVEIKAGESCILPAGFEGVFEIVEPSRNYYVIVDRNRI